MDLQKYQDVLAGALSGGNKRKLSVAIALMGIQWKFFSILHIQIL